MILIDVQRSTVCRLLLVPAPATATGIVVIITRFSRLARRMITVVVVRVHRPLLHDVS